jgi:hypothetical protein
MSNPDIQILVQRVVENVSRGSRAFEWAMQLAAAVNRTVPCEACEGTGTREKHERCHHDTQSRYVLGCYDKLDCKDCHGIGRVYSAWPTKPSIQCWLCHEAIRGKVHYQGGAETQPSHKGCLVRPAA